MVGAFGGLKSAKTCYSGVTKRCHNVTFVDLYQSRRGEKRVLCQIVCAHSKKVVILHCLKERYKITV